MRFLTYILIGILCALPAHSETSFVHQVKKGQWLESILIGLGIPQPWKVESWANRLTRWNRHILLNSSGLIPAGTLLQVPIEVFPPGKWKTDNYIEVFVEDKISIDHFLHQYGIKNPRKIESWVSRIIRLNETLISSKGSQLEIGDRLIIPIDIPPLAFGNTTTTGET